MENDQETPPPQIVPIEPIQIPRPVPNANQPLQKGLDSDKLEHR